MFGLPKDNARYQSWYGWFWLLIVVVALLLGLWQRFTQSENPSAVDITYLNEQTCTDSGGHWNDCGSACRNEPGEPCIQVCVAYCECQATDQCPFGYVCGEVIDNTGICLKP
jgi:hypothetical protein